MYPQPAIYFQFGSLERVDLPGYLVAFDGTVWDCRSPCAQAVRADGARVALRDGTGRRRRLKLNRLVASSWHGRPRETTDSACHLDGDPQNNRACNLDWQPPDLTSAERRIGCRLRRNVALLRRVVRVLRAAEEFTEAELAEILCLTEQDLMVLLRRPG